MKQDRLLIIEASEEYMRAHFTILSTLGVFETEYFQKIKFPPKN